ncbi:MAG TPA: glycosyltransferase family 4 protein [bacterium]|jgi:glycosyltransferase involved in cell wall biosynthesis|nr:glycosyltransferase family 4 protein [bacterium]
MIPSIRVAHVAAVDLTHRFLLASQLMALRREGFDVSAVSGPGPWAGDLEERGIRHYAVPSLNRSRNPAADLRAVVELVRLFRRERFAIVHTHMPKGGLLGRVAARIAGVPIIVHTVHGLYGIDPGSQLRRWFYLTLERGAARLSDYEFCQSREIFDLLTGIGIFHPERSAHLGNGVDLEHFDPTAVPAEEVARLRASLDIPEGVPVVGMVGRLAWDKGYGEFIAAATEVCRRRPEVAFLAVGPRDDRDALPDEAIRTGEAAGVRFLGLRMDMRELYRLMDLFILASYREGFPRSAIEAAAMGTPLILTDIPGCREVVTPGRNGLLIPPRRVEPLTEAILHLLDDAALRRRFGEESRRRAEAEFDERRVFARILDLYATLLRQREIVPSGIGAESTARR